MSDAQHKEEHLQDVLRGMGCVLVAVSGGVDSSYMLAVAAEVLGPGAQAVTARAELYPDEELEAAQALAHRLGVAHRFVSVKPLEIPPVRDNAPDRCYHCKHAVFSRLCELAAAEGLGQVVDGTHAEDADDYRPGERALRELGVRSPLREAGLTKADIRARSRARSLPSWDYPPRACLATRFPYGEPLTPEKLAQVAEAERVLAQAGFRQYRVRYHGPVARLEIPEEDLPRLVEKPLRDLLVARLRELGFIFVSLDLAGFRSGSMNEELKR